LLHEGIAAQAEFEAAMHDLEKARAALVSLSAKRSAAITSASERLRLLGVPADAVEKVLASKRVNNAFEIKAPRSGVISERTANPGQLVGTDKPLFVITDLSRVWLVAQVFENKIGKVEVGQPVELLVDTYPGQVFAGRIDYVAGSIDPDTRTLSVRATVQNALEMLKPQMFARMTIRTGTSCLLAVPQAAVQRTGEVDLAYVPLPGNRFEERRLTLGPTIGPFVAVKSGLKQGEIVVVNGSLELNGQSIQNQGTSAEAN
jgi:RND family efflux transporter MFP subunit